MTCGNIRYRLGWALSKDGEVLAPTGPLPGSGVASANLPVCMIFFFSLMRLLMIREM